MSKRIVWLLRIVFSYIGAVISLFVAHYFNPFSIMSFIPGDKAYDVCITIYFSVSELVVSVAIAKIDAMVDSLFSDVRVMFSHRNEKVEINSQPAIHFNELDMSEVELSVIIRGPKKFFADTTIIIPKIAQADYQLGRECIGARINENGDFCIDLMTLCGQIQNVDMTEKFLITLQRAPIDNSAEIVITPEISPKSHGRIRFSYNTVAVQLEEHR